MDSPSALVDLARELGVHTRFVDGLGRPVTVSADTLTRVCRALGAELEGPDDAAVALAAIRAAKAVEVLPPTVVAWDGRLEVTLGAGESDHPTPATSGISGEISLEDGGTAAVEIESGRLRTSEPLPPGYHTLHLTVAGTPHRATLISAPVQAWRRPDSDDSTRGWGVGTQLGALRTRRSRALGDLRDLEWSCRRIGEFGGDLVTVLPILPTFNDAGDPEPSPYSPASRLFWSELILDLGELHTPVGEVRTLDVVAADREVRRFVNTLPDPEPEEVDAELALYARFRGAQRRLGRNWKAWPEPARSGELLDDQVDGAEERFHLKAQLAVRSQLDDLLRALRPTGVRIGLDLAVGVHPDGFESWARQQIFAQGMSVGAPPDPGFPSGQDWGFSPVVPSASRREGHRYIADSIAHQARLAGVLRVDHVMAFTRLYWIPHGMSLHEGTYVSYPPEELFAILTLESHRHRCEVVGENLGTVPPEIDEALPRHAIRGMHLSIFAAGHPHPPQAGTDMVGFIGTHDTPTFAGWIDGTDIGLRVECGLLHPEVEPGERAERARQVENLARFLGTTPDARGDFLGRLLEWMGWSDSPLVIPWIEDFWLEPGQVNLPGTRASERPNWQRPMRAPVDELLADPEVVSRIERLAAARRGAAEG